MRKLKFIQQELWRMMGVSKGATAVVFTTNVFAAVIALFYTASLNRMFSAITAGGWSSALIWAFLMLGAMIILQDILNAVTNYAMDWQTMKVQKGYMASFFDKTNRLDAAQMQNPKILDILNSIRNGKDASVEFLIHTELLFSYYLLYYGLMMIYLWRIHWLLVAAMTAVYIPSILTYRLKSRISLQNEAEIAGYRRQKAAFCSYVMNQKYLKESRFWRIEKMFGRRFQKACKGFSQERMRGFRKQNGISLFTNFTYVIGFGVVLAAILFLVRQQVVSAAEVATVLTIVIFIYDSMDELMNFHIAGMAQNLSGLMNMHRLLEITAEDGFEGPSSPEGSGSLKGLGGAGYAVELDHVSFSYPDAESFAVKDVSLRIEEGELLAIVGENGSGKTTLSKILCGLYPPSKGRMIVNGVERKNIPREALMGKVSAAFQDFRRYPLTIGENIGIAVPDRSADKEELGRLAEFVDIGGKVASEEKGFDTLLSREFGGVDWSGGLWQRLAIARAAYKECSFFLFDEPTAAIDPLEELDIMKKMADFAKGKTAVLVTHRIGAARLADRIVVMAHGSICETGTHEELLKRGGEYARMYKAQSEAYVS